MSDKTKEAAAAVPPEEQDTGTAVPPEGEDTETTAPPEGQDAADATPPEGEVTETTAPPEDQDTEPPTAQKFKLARVLKVTKPLIKGKDVKAVQEALIFNGFGCGVEGANSVYNAATAYAVRQFQAMHRLIVSGRVEKFTATALGAEWKDQPSEKK